VKYRVELQSIWQALEGDHRWLMSRLRQGVASCAEQTLAADLIEGVIEPRRPRSRSSSRQGRLEIARSVAFLKKTRPGQLKAIIAAVAKVFGVSERHVYNALKAFDENALAQIERMRKPTPRAVKAYQDRINGEQVTIKESKLAYDANDLSYLDRDTLEQMILARNQELARK
jgi:hypothetical protein